VQELFPNGPSEFERLFGTSADACLANLISELAPAAVQASVNAGRIEYREADARACLAHGASLTCSEWWNSELAFHQRAVVGYSRDCGSLASRV
jgi:hypothetical protein